MRVQILVAGILVGVGVFTGCASPNLNTHFPAYADQGFVSNSDGSALPREMKSWFIVSEIRLIKTPRGRDGVWLYFGGPQEYSILLILNNNSSHLAGRYSTTDQTLRAWLLRPGGLESAEYRQAVTGMIDDPAQRNSWPDAIPLQGKIEFTLAKDADSMPEEGKIDKLDVHLKSNDNIPIDRRYYQAWIDNLAELIDNPSNAKPDDDRRQMADLKQIIQRPPAAPFDIEASFWREWISRKRRILL